MTHTKRNTEEWAQQGSFSGAPLFWGVEKHTADAWSKISAMRLCYKAVLL